MKRFNLSRKEKLLFVTPLLLPLLVMAWPLVAGNSFERTLRGLAGLEAVDCGLASFDSEFFADSCAVAAFKAGKPFMLRQHIGGDLMAGMARTPQGQFYTVHYYRPENWTKKGKLIQRLQSNANVARWTDGKERIDYDYQPHAIETTYAWW